MAHVEIAINELRDVATASRVEGEIYEAAERAADPDSGRVGISVLDEGRSVDIEMELPGWIARRSLSPEPEPGEVRAAVEELLESVGLM